MNFLWHVWRVSPDGKVREVILVFARSNSEARYIASEDEWTVLETGDPIVCYPHDYGPARVAQGVDWIIKEKEEGSWV